MISRLKQYLILRKFVYLVVFSLSCNYGFSQYGWTEAEVYMKDGRVLKGHASVPMENTNVNAMNPFGKSKERVKYKLDKKGKKEKFDAHLVDSIIFTVDYEEKIDKNWVEKTRKAIFVPVYLDKKKKKQGFAELIVDGEIRLVGRTVMYSSSTMVHGPTSINANGDMIYFPPVYQHHSGTHNNLLLVREGHKAIKINQVSLFKAFKKRASDFFKDCPSLVAKIENKEFKKEDLIPIVEYYNTNCAK